MARALVGKDGRQRRWTGLAPLGLRAFAALGAMKGSFIALGVTKDPFIASSVTKGSFIAPERGFWRGVDAVFGWSDGG